MARSFGTGLSSDDQAATRPDPSGIDPSRGPAAGSKLKQLEDLEDWLVAHAGIGTWAANSTAKALLRREGSPLARIRSEMPPTLNTGNLVHDVRSLRIAHDSMHRHAYQWGKAMLLLLPFVDMAAGEGLEWAEQDDGSPRMDAAELCVAFAKAMGCELGDTAYAAMLKEGTDAIRALAQGMEAGTGETEGLDPKEATDVSSSLRDVDPSRGAQHD